MASISDLTPGTWTVDAAHSRIGFTARHLMIAKTRGHFSSFSGTITVPEDRLQSSVEATVDATSVTTDDQARDGHLKSADFFDAENHPTWTLRSTGIKADGGDYLLSADLTVRGVTHPVELELEFEGVTKDPWGNTKAGFTATTEISRKDFGIEFNVALETGGVLVGDKVKIELEIEAAKAA
jgi:polyisoprenoid-binding protein YceI